MKKEVSIKALRMIPPIAAGMMLLHVTCLLLGVNEYITEILMICCGFFLASSFSKALNFCTIHRLLIYYAYIMICCIWWQRYGLGFGNFLFTARLFMMILGCLLFVLLYLNYILDK